MFIVKLNAAAALAIFGQPYTALAMLAWAFLGLVGREDEDDEDEE